MNKQILMAALTVSALVLGGCSSDGSSAEGIEVEVLARALASATDLAKDDEEPESVTFRRADGMKVELLLGMINLVPIELQACEVSATARLLRLLAPLSPIASAFAHGSGEGGAEGGALDVLDGVAKDLGELAAAPGSYCGLVVELQPGGVEEAKHGAPLDESMAGVGVNVAPCYYPSTVGLSDEEAAAVHDHHCIQVRTLSEAVRVTLPLPEPVTLDSANRELQLIVGTWYETWFDGIDFDLLKTDAAQQALLADNVASSLVLSVGEGE